VIVFFGQFFENYRSKPNIWATLFHGKSCLIILTKTELVFILGNCFTNSSGHPDSEPASKVFDLQKLLFDIEGERKADIHQNE
jgi:hypothetical protein